MNADPTPLARYFDTHARDYLNKGYESPPAGHYPVFRMRHERILAMTEGLQPGRALDIGCGCGIGVADLARRGWDATGIDLSPRMIEEAEALLARSGLGPDRARVSRTPLDGANLPAEAFDLVVAAGVIDYQTDDRPFLETIARLLRPGGVVLLSARNRICPAVLFWRTVGAAARLPVLGAALRAAESVLRAALRRPRATGDGDPSAVLQRTHIPWRLDRALCAAGLVPEARAGTHFYALPFPLSRLLPRLEVRLGLAMERAFARTPLRILASGYVVRARRAPAGA